MNKKAIYSPRRVVTDLNQCGFYHTMELPGFGLIQGQWDLRGGVDAYLGNVDFMGKRVLEIGTASGFICFEMEKRGAEVVAYDLSEKDAWDIVPFNGRIPKAQLDQMKKMIRALNNSWWLAHRVYQSNARVVYGPVYEIPDEIGPVHISTFGSILLHLRDPFLALQKASRLTTETMIVTDLIWPPESKRLNFLQRRFKAPNKSGPLGIPEITFFPDPDKDVMDQSVTWWHFSPDLISRFLKILGFKIVQTSFHTQKHGIPPHQNELNLFTVVGHRR